MKKYIAFVMVLGLVGIATAQDLDAPTMGATVDAEDSADNGSTLSHFDLIISKIKEAEDKFLQSRNGIGHFEWSTWANPMGWDSGWFQTMRQWGWAKDSSEAEVEAAREMWQTLTAAETAAARAISSESRERLLAAGLN